MRPNVEKKQDDATVNKFGTIRDRNTGFCESLEMRWYGDHCGCTVPQGAFANLCNFYLMWRTFVGYFEVILSYNFF